jgi:hypothetical protein
VAVRRTRRPLVGWPERLDQPKREQPPGFHRYAFALVTGRRRQFLPGEVGKEMRVKTRLLATGVISAGMILALASCTNPYDPGQRAVGGGLIGAGAGAALGGAVGGGTGAAIGAATGGAVGAITGAATTPPPPGYYPPPPPPRY